MARTKRLSPQDMMMRVDGYVTAVEVSEATGLALSAIHRGIDKGLIPGKNLAIGPRYKRHYVKLDQFIQTGNYAGSETVRANLKVLTSAVQEAKKTPTPRSIPRPPPA